MIIFWCSVIKIFIKVNMCKIFMCNDYSNNDSITVSTNCFEF